MLPFIFNGIPMVSSESVRTGALDVLALQAMLAGMQVGSRIWWNKQKQKTIFAELKAEGARI